MHVNEVQMTGVHCEMAAEWEAPCDTPEWAAGGWQEGEDGDIHKGAFRNYRLGTRLALVLLSFPETAGGGCFLVRTEWRNYCWNNRGEKVYYPHIALPSVSTLCHYFIVWFTTLSCSCGLKDLTVFLARQTFYEHTHSPCKSVTNLHFF